jgi:hypothetical protein
VRPSLVFPHARPSANTLPSCSRGCCRYRGTGRRGSFRLPSSRIACCSAFSSRSVIGVAQLGGGMPGPRPVAILAAVAVRVSAFQVAAANGKWPLRFPAGRMAHAGSKCRGGRFTIVSVARVQRVFHTS